jgi:hypothetical protein
VDSGTAESGVSAKVAAVHEDEVFDLLTEIESTSAPRSKAERLSAQAALMTIGEHGRATFLVAAGQHHQMHGDFHSARRCFEEADADGGESMTEPLANLHSLALAMRDDAAADLHLAELRRLARLGLADAGTCMFVAETLESHHRLQEAARWFTLPLRDIEPDDVDELDPFCLQGRLRVRTELGLRPDRYDIVALTQLEARVQRGAGD